MKNIVFLGLLFCGFIACQGQEQKPDKNKTTTTTQTPHGSWTVNEEYDDNGNLISRDSTYSYSYSSINGQEVSPEEMDSIFGRMQSKLPFDLNSDDMGNFMQNFGDMSINDFMQGFGDMDLQGFMQGLNDTDTNGFFNDFFNDSDSSSTDEKNDAPGKSIHDQMMERMKQFQEQFFQSHPQQGQRVIPRESEQSATETNLQSI